MDYFLLGNAPWGLGTFRVLPHDKPSCSGFAWRWRVLTCLWWRNLSEEGIDKVHEMIRFKDVLCIAWTRNTELVSEKENVILRTLPCPARGHPDVANVSSFNHIVKRLHRLFNRRLIVEAMACRRMLHKCNIIEGQETNIHCKTSIYSNWSRSKLALTESNIC